MEEAINIGYVRFYRRGKKHCCHGFIYTWVAVSLSVCLVEAKSDMTHSCRRIHEMLVSCGELQIFAQAINAMLILNGTCIAFTSN